MAIVIIAGVRGGLDRGPYACLLLKSFCRGWCWNGQSKTTTADTDTPPRNQSIANPTAPHWTACCETKRPPPRRATMAWHSAILHRHVRPDKVRPGDATRWHPAQLNSSCCVAGRHATCATRKQWAKLHRCTLAPRGTAAAHGTGRNKRVVAGTARHTVRAGVVCDVVQELIAVGWAWRWNFKAISHGIVNAFVAWFRRRRRDVCCC